MSSFAEHRSKVLKNLALNDPDSYIRFYDDFNTIPIDDTTGLPTAWANVADAGATGKSGASDGKAGLFQIYCDGDDNDESYMSSVNEAFIFNATDEVYFEVEVKFTEAGTAGLSSFIVGLSDVVAANSILDSGLIMASFDGVCFIKEGEGTSSNIAMVSSNAGTAVRTASMQSWVDATTYNLGFLYVPNDGTTGKVLPLIDGIQPKDSAGAYISHDITISGLEEMHALLGVKTQVAGSEQFLLVDNILVIQKR